MLYGLESFNTIKINDKEYNIRNYTIELTK